MKRGRKRKLTAEDCVEIKRMYCAPQASANTRALAHMFRVSMATINKVLNGNYEPLEQEGAAMRGRRSTKTPSQRAEDLRKAVNRAGFTPVETFRILSNWWQLPDTTITFVTGAVTISKYDYKEEAHADAEGTQETHENISQP